MSNDNLEASGVAVGIGGDVGASPAAAAAEVAAAAAVAGFSHLFAAAVDAFVACAIVFTTAGR